MKDNKDEQIDLSSLVDKYKSEAKKFNDGNKVPIYKGCQNGRCFCTGECKKIIGFKDKLPNA